MSRKADTCDTHAAKLPDYDEALQRVLTHAPTLRTECVDLDETLGRVLAGDVSSDRDQPPFNRSAMDGYAVRSGVFNAQSTEHVWPIVGGIAAGDAPVVTGDVERGVIRIATGAAVPEPFDAVIPIELATPDDDATPPTVRFNVEQVNAWLNIHRRGADAPRGATVLASGQFLTPACIGIAATVGVTDLKVVEQPRVTILTSGEEVRGPDTSSDDLPAHHIRNSNGPMLMALFKSLGAPLLRHMHIGDDPQETLAAAREALSTSHLVVTVGGASVGAADYLRSVWPKLGYDLVLEGARIQPGKPVFAAAPREQADENKLVIGLPGNPVSVLATAHLFAWPIVRRMLCMSDADLPWRPITLAEPMRAKSARQLFRAVTIDERGRAKPITWHGSGDLMHLASAAGWVALPLQDGDVPAGEAVTFLPMVGGVR